MPITADPEAVAYWGNYLDAALASHGDAEEALMAAKLVCDLACTEAQVAAAVDPSEENRLAEEAAHQAHKAQLAAAYSVFGHVAVGERNLKRARVGLPAEGASAPASSGLTEVSAAVEVASEITPG
jgi:hypothetical protein